MRYLYSIRAKWLTAAALIFASGGGFVRCSSYEEIDFQKERCKQAPRGGIKVVDRGNFRREFEVNQSGNTPESAPIRVTWIVEEHSFTARWLSYQFEKKGEQKVTVIMTNPCFMQTTKDTIIQVK